MMQTRIVSFAYIFLSTISLLSCLKYVSSFNQGNQRQNKPLNTMQESKHAIRQYRWGLKMKEGEDLTNAEISRYSRHLVLSDVGMKGQRALKNASVLVIGAGKVTLKLKHDCYN